MERPNNDEERTEALRKELLRLKDEEVAQIEKGGGDSDLLALRSEWVGGLGEEELSVLRRFLALKKGVEAGYHFEEDEIRDTPQMLQKLTKAVVKRLNTFLSDEEKKLGRKLTDEEKADFRRRFGNEDYVALYHRWVKRQFDNFFKDHPEYKYEETGAAK